MALARQRCLFRVYKASFGHEKLLRHCLQATAFKSTNTAVEGIDPTTRKFDKKTVINQPTEAVHPQIDLSFSNAQEAYKSKRTSELVRALLVFNLCSISVLVDNQKQLLKWSRKALGKNLFRKLMQQTFYGHFVAGEDQDTIKPLIMANRQFGVKSILDYSAEEDISQKEAVQAEMMGCAPEHPIADHAVSAGTAQFQPHEEFGDRRDKVISARTYFYEDERQCDHNMEIFLNCIDAVSHATEKSGLAAIKLTALGKPQLLLQMSEVLTTVKNFFTMFVGMPEGRHEMGGRLFEVEDFDQRLSQMGVSLKDKGSRKRVSIMEVSNNGKVDLLDWQNLLEINRSISKLFLVPDLKTGKLRPIVDEMTEQEEEQMKNMLRRVNTLAKYASEKEVRIMVDAEQTYFQPAISRLTMEMMRKFNKERSVVFNTYQCYLKERERAVSVGYEDPINPTYDATTEMYHMVMEEVMRQINLRDRGKIAVMIASHNEDTIRKAVDLMKQYNIGPDDRLICFGQLLGMCDHVSFPLGQAGYSVYKYVPFGPVEEVLPYLSRRAMENRGILKKVKKEKTLLAHELFRRFKTGQLFYDPTSQLVTTPLS